MTIYELENFLVSECANWNGDYVAMLSYHYNNDTEMHKSNEVFSLNEDCNQVIWFNDWYEGQEEIELMGFYRIDYILMYYLLLL